MSFNCSSYDEFLQTDLLTIFNLIPFYSRIFKFRIILHLLQFLANLFFLIFPTNNAILHYIQCQFSFLQDRSQ